MTPDGRTTHREGTARSPYLWLMVLMVASYCAWILSLPLFPMQDGPMHLYLAHVLHAVQGSSPSVYKEVYTAPRLLTPYCLQYYVLILLTHFVSAVAAEKLFVVLIVATQCFGFRYLCTAIGEAGELASLFIVAVVLNWPLMMGFQSYALAVALACWALAMWTRALQHGGRYHRVGFVACCCAILLTHPLPYLLVLAIGGAELLLCLHHSPEGWRHRPTWRSDVATFTSACLPLLFLWSFTRTHRAREALVWAHPGERIRYFLGLHGVNFFGGGSLAVRLYEAAVLASLLGALAIACAMFWKRARNLAQPWSPASTWLFATIALLIVLPLLPDNFGGSRAIALRMEPLLWIGALAAVSGAPWPRPKVARTLTLIAVASAMLALGLSMARIIPVARRIAAGVDAMPQNASPQAGAGKRGLLLTVGEDAETDFASLLYGPYYWEGVSYFRRTNAVLLNTPWMDSTWLPVQPRGDGDRSRGLLIEQGIDPDAIEFYWKLRALLVSSPAARQQVLSQTDFVIFPDPYRSATEADFDRAFALPGHRWSCDRHDWYVLCEKQ